jgi:BirA family transcriptional regulator, biotin operon repressor / biotin---[acetyl-CoA-carboxylase] ligase
MNQAVNSWLVELPACSSTNTWALDHIDALAHGACVWTQKQEAGRGRDGSAWRSPPGVLTATFVLDVDDAIDAGRLGLAAGLVVCHAVEDLIPYVRVQVKWPNDCVVGDKKVAGILCERRARGKIVVGIGLNVSVRWNAESLAVITPSSTLPPGSLSDFADAVPAMEDLLPLLRKYLLEAAGLVQAGGWAPLVDSLRDRDWLAGRAVQLESAGDIVNGTAAGIDAQGHLLLANESGIRSFASARILLNPTGAEHLSAENEQAMETEP